MRYVLLLLLVLGEPLHAQPALIPRQIVAPSVLAAALPDSLPSQRVPARGTVHVSDDEQGWQAFSYARSMTSGMNGQRTLVAARAYSYSRAEVLRSRSGVDGPTETRDTTLQGFDVVLARGGYHLPATRWTTQIVLTERREVWAEAGSEAELLVALRDTDLRRLATAPADSTLLIGSYTGALFETREAFEALRAALTPRVVHLAIPTEDFAPEAPDSLVRYKDPDLMFSLARSLDGWPAPASDRLLVRYGWSTGSARRKTHLVIEDVDAAPGRSAAVLAAVQQAGHRVRKVRGYPTFVRADTLVIDSGRLVSVDSVLVVLVGDRRRVAVTNPGSAPAQALLEVFDFDALEALVPQRTVLTRRVVHDEGKAKPGPWRRFKGPWLPDPGARPRRVVVEPDWWPEGLPRPGPFAFTLPDGWYFTNPREAECNHYASGLPLVVMAETPLDPCTDWDTPYVSLTPPELALYEVEYGRPVPQEWLERWKGYAYDKLPGRLRKYEAPFSVEGAPRRGRAGNHEVVWLDLVGPEGALRARAGYVDIQGVTYLGLAVGKADEVEPVYAALREVLTTLAPGP